MMQHIQISDYIHDHFKVLLGPLQIKFGGPTLV